MWEIFAYQNSESLYGIFNAIAAIRGSNTYLGALAGVAFCGFVAALLAYAFAPQKLQGWQWLASVVLVYSVLFVPRVTVGIVDKTGGGPERIVDNVPFGLAVFGGMTSTIGNSLTELFETAFQIIPGPGGLPSELTYQRSGLMFGSRMIREASRVVFRDPNFRTDMLNFIYNCTMFDLVDGTINPVTFSTSTNVWPLISTPNPARFSTVTSATGTVDTATCPDVYASLDTRLPAEVTRIEGTLAFRMNPTLPAAAASAAIAGQIQQAYIKNSIANASATAADIIRQNAVLNAINDSSQLSGQKINDPAAMILAVGRAQATAQTNASWLNNGKIAEQALPVIRNVVEAITYAMFPILVLLLLLTSGRETVMALKNYLIVLIWIQLWPPLYAVLNYAASIYAAMDLSSAAELGGGLKGLSLLTSPSIYSSAISSEAVVGWLTMSIPFIAWAAVKRMETFGSALVSGITPLQSAVGSATSAAAAGNLSMGNIAMDQVQLAPNRSSAFMSSMQNDLSGNTFSTNAVTGVSAVNMLRNQGIASRVVSVKVGEQEVMEANHSADAARTEATAAISERSAVFADIFSRGTSKLDGLRNAHSDSSSSYQESGEGLDHLSQITDQVASKTGLSQQQVAQIAFSASAHGGVGFGKKGGRFNAGIDINGTAKKSYNAGISAEEQKVLSHLTQDQLAEFARFGDRLQHDDSVLKTISRDTREASELSSRLATTTSRAERAEANFAERLAYAERLSSAKDRGESISIDIAADPHNIEMFRRYAEQYGGTSQSARVMIDSELARQALKPNRVFSDGTAVPLSFKDAKDRHKADRNFAQVNSNIAAQAKENTGAVRQNDTSIAPPRERPKTGNSGAMMTRENIEAEGRKIREQINLSSTEYNSNTGITRDKSGAPETRRSLLLDTADQAGKDATNTLKNAEEAVKNTLENRK